MMRTSRRTKNLARRRTRMRRRRKRRRTRRGSRSGAVQWRKDLKRVARRGGTNLVYSIRPFGPLTKISHHLAFGIICKSMLRKQAIFLGSGSRYFFSAPAPEKKYWLRLYLLKPRLRPLRLQKHLQNLNFNKKALINLAFVQKTGKNL